ncbi:MAG: lysozyme inhibitor LprI family protein [Pseudomonadota bacterium]
MRQFLIYAMMELGALSFIPSAFSQPPLTEPENAAEVTRECLQAAKPTTDDIKHCAEASRAFCAGLSTYSMNWCYRRQQEIWDEFVETAYNELHAVLAQQDIVSVKGETATHLLNQAQIAWHDWKNTQCDFEYGRIGDGSARGPTSYRCRHEIVAERAQYLAGLVWYYRDR